MPKKEKGKASQEYENPAIDEENESNEYDDTGNEKQIDRDLDHPSFASSKKSFKAINEDSRKNSEESSNTERPSSSALPKGKKKKGDSRYEKDYPPVYDELPTGSGKVLEIASDDDVDPRESSAAYKYNTAPPTRTRQGSNSSARSAKREKKKREGINEQSILEDQELSSEPQLTSARVKSPSISKSEAPSRLRSKSVQLSSKSLQLNSNEISSKSQTKIEVPVVIQNEGIRPSNYKRQSNFDLFAPTENLPVIVFDTLSDTAENDLPPPGFERNRNVRRTSQQLPQVPLVTPQNSELIMKPNLIMTPLDTAHRLQIVEQNSRSRGFSASHLMLEEHESPIRTHSVAESKKVKKIAKRKSVQTKPRRCNNCVTTIWWGILTYIVIMISILAIQLGNIGKLVYPFDSAGTQCGVDELSKMTALYYFNMTSVRAYKRCVETCPPSTTPICKYNITFSWENYALRKEQLASGDCIWSKGAYVNAFYRCVSLDLAGTNYLTAQQAAATEALTEDLQSQNVMTSFFNILINCIAVLASCTVGSVVASAIWYFLLLAIGPSLLYCSVLIIFVSLWGGAAYLAYQYYQLNELSNGFTSQSYIQLDSTLIYNPTIVLGGMIVLALFAFIFTGIIISARKSVRLAGKIMTEAANHLMNIYLVPFFMIIQSVFAIILSGFAILVVGLLYTVGPNASLGITVQSFTRSLIQPLMIDIYVAIFVFWYVWTLLINYAFGRAAIAKSVGKVYWSGSGAIKGTTWIGKNSLDILFHHFGTLAYGVLAIPVVFVLNIIEYSIRPSFSKAQNIVETKVIVGDNFLDRLKLWVTHVLQDINHRAFIQIALGGGDLCSASRVASDVFQSELNGVMRMGRAISWICVLSIAFGISVLALILTNTTTSASSLSSALPIIIVILLCALYVSSIFIQSFAIAIDTILYCYCEDLEMNDGSPMMPYAMPETLKLFIEDLHLKPDDS